MNWKHISKGHVIVKADYDKLVYEKKIEYEPTFDNVTHQYYRDELLLIGVSLLLDNIE